MLVDAFLSEFLQNIMYKLWKIKNLPVVKKINSQHMHSKDKGKSDYHFSEEIDLLTEAFNSNDNKEFLRRMLFTNKENTEQVKSLKEIFDIINLDKSRNEKAAHGKTSNDADLRASRDDQLHLSTISGK